METEPLPLTQRQDGKPVTKDGINKGLASSSPRNLHLQIRHFLNAACCLGQRRQSSF